MTLWQPLEKQLQILNLIEVKKVKMIRAILRFFGNAFIGVFFLIANLALWIRFGEFVEWQMVKFSKEKDDALKFRNRNPWLWRFMDLMLLLAFIAGTITIILSIHVGSWEHGWGILTKAQMLYICLPMGLSSLLIFITYTFMSIKSRLKERENN